MLKDDPTPNELAPGATAPIVTGLLARSPGRSGRRGAWAGLSVALLIVLVPALAKAENKFVDLHVSAAVGAFAGGGSGTAQPAGSTKKAQTDFFEQVRGPAAGIELGVRLLVLDLSARFLQAFDGGGRQGTLSQLSLAFVLAIPVGRSGLDALGRAQPGATYICPSANVGFGIGTLGPINPPLSNDQIAQKGLLTGGSLGVEHFFGKFFSLEGRAEGGYHYFFGAQQALNAQSASSGWQIAGFGFATVHLGL